MLDHVKYILYKPNVDLVSSKADLVSDVAAANAGSSVTLKSK